MEYWPKHLLSYFLTSVLSNIIFVIYLKTTNYSGGEIGMAPFITMLNAIITFAISLVVLICLRIFRVKVSIFISLVIFSLVSTSVLFTYFKIKPFEGYLSDVNLMALLSVIIASLLIYFVFLIKKKFV
jgi:hypothetical protein